MNCKTDEVLTVTLNRLYFIPHKEGGGCPHCHETNKNKRDKETGIRTCQNEACRGRYTIVMPGEEPSQEEEESKEEKASLDFADESELPEVPPDEEIPEVRFSVWRKKKCPHCHETIAHRKLHGGLCLCRNEECNRYYRIIIGERD